MPSSNFQIAEDGAARWYLLNAQDQPVQKCTSAGQVVVAEAFGRMETYAGQIPGTGSQPLSIVGLTVDHITDDWRAPLGAIATYKFANLSSFGQSATAAGGGTVPPNTLLNILGRNMSTWTSVDDAMVTAFLVWLAFYDDGSNTLPGGAAVPFSSVQLPSDVVPLPFPGKPDSFSQADYAALPQDPVCYNADAVLPDPGSGNVPPGPDASGYPASLGVTYSDQTVNGQPVAGAAPAPGVFVAAPAMTRNTWPWFGAGAAVGVTATPVARWLGKLFGR